MQFHSSLIHAIVLDGRGGGRPLTWSEVGAWTPESGFLWLHFKLQEPDSLVWLEQEGGFDSVVAGVLQSEDNHPRVVWEENALIGTLRGVNFNRQVESEEMVFVNFFIDASRAVTTRRAQVMTIKDVAQDLAAGHGPTGPGSLLTAILQRLHNRMEPTLEEIEEELDTYEQSLSPNGEHEEDLPEKLMGLRHEIIQMRRFLSPQKAAMAAFGRGAPPWLSRKRLREIREIEGRLQSFLGDLESYRERAMVIREEINNKMAERMNRAMYMLSVITGVFLPLGFMTGLLGINVGGLPGVENPWAFWIVCVLLAAIFVLSLVVFHRKRWI